MVNSHFPHPPDTRMPKIPEGVDELGIRYEGPVLTGLRGVREAFQDQAAKLLVPHQSFLPDLGPAVNVTPMYPHPPADAQYANPQQYDPVLRYHLRLPPAPK